MDNYYVPKHYQMNPETDVLIPDGYDLGLGMVVLVANSDFRVLDWVLDRHDATWRDKILQRHTRPLTTTKALSESYERLPVVDPSYKGGAMEAVREALKFNRWCTVSDVRLRTHTHAAIKNRIIFLGTYNDGSRFKHYVNVDVPWFAKKESV